MSRLNKATETHQSLVSAKQIYQQYLDECSDALMSWDVEKLMDGHTFPFRVITQREDFVIETREELLESLTLLHKNFMKMEVDNYIRLASDAEFLRDDHIEGHHFTHIMKGANAEVPFYQNKMVLVRNDNTWRASFIQSELENEQWPISLPKVSRSSRATLNKYDPTGELQAHNSTPMEIYQSYLNELSEINLNRSFDGWCAYCAFPHSVHIDTFDEVIAEPSEIRPFVEMLHNLIDEHKVDRFERVGDHAEFLSPTEICGYHTTTLYCGDEIKLGPVSSRYILKRSGTVWQMQSVSNSIANTQFPYSLPKISKDLVSLRDIKKRNKSP